MYARRSSRPPVYRLFLEYNQDPHLNAGLFVPDSTFCEIEYQLAMYLTQKRKVKSRNPKSRKKKLDM